MRESSVITIDSREYAELKRLVDAARNAGDVQYAAFSALCPTGEEGVFDTSACEAYRRLQAAGFVEGDFDDGAFYFRALTYEGVRHVERLEDPDEEAWGGDAGHSSAAEPAPDKKGADVSAAAASSKHSQAASSAFNPVKAPLQIQRYTQPQGSVAPGAWRKEALKLSATAIAIAVVAGLVAGFIGGLAGAFVFEAFLS